MIRDDILWAINLTLLPLSALSAYYSLKFQSYMAKKGYDGQPHGMVILVRAISALTCAAFITSAAWMAWDLGFTDLNQTRDMGIIIRGFLLFGVYLCCAFHHVTMERQTGHSFFRDWFPVGAVLYFILVYIFMILRG